MGGTGVATSPSALGSEIQRAGLLESITRFGALLVGITYVSGFIIVTLHHAQYGVGEISLLRARVFSAGILFTLLTALPLMASARLHGYFGFSTASGYTIDTKPEERSIGEALVTIGMYAACVALAFATTPLFEYTDAPYSWWQAMLMWLAFFVMVFLHPFIKEHPRKCVLVLLVAMVVLGWGAYKVEGAAFLFRSLWFYACGLSAKGLHRLTRDPGKWRAFEWERYVGVLFALVLFFSSFVYGDVRFRFGGGATIPVKLYLTPEANSILASGETFLVEETEVGFYLLNAPHAKASFFLPRTLVRGIEFNPPKNASKAEATGDIKD